MSAPIVALDHFAGTGWAVACHWLGIREYGVEIMKEAIFTRRAVGFRTIYRDVWSGLFHPHLVPPHEMYIASPPCQTFSVAGRGTGRKALEMVLSLIESGTWKEPAKLRAAGADLGDDRTALVLTPLAHIWAHRPRLVALEQVPTVLPVWEAMAEVLRGLGYSVWTGNLQVAAHEERGDGFFPASYIAARREAVLARKFQESKRAALATARAQMTAARLGDL